MMLDAALHDQRRGATTILERAVETVAKTPPAPRSTTSNVATSTILERALGSWR